MTFDRFLEELPELTRELDQVEQDSLKGMLSSTPIKVALSLVMLERSKLAQATLAQKLEDRTAEQVLISVARNQGEAIGLYKAVALLFELVGEEEEEPPAEE